MSYRLRFGVVLISAALLLSIGSAHAGTITQYTTRAAWLAALSGSPNDLPFTTLTSSSNINTTLAPFSFSGSALQPANGFLLGSSVTITEPAGGETAFYFFTLNRYPASAPSFTLSLSDGETLGTPQNPLPLGGFWFTSPTPITSLTLTATSSYIGLADLQYGTAGNPQSPTPEAATFLLTAGGALILLGSGRKLAKRRTA